METAITYSLGAARQGAIPLKILVEQNRPLQERVGKVEASLTQLAAADQSPGLPHLSIHQVRAILEQARPEEQRRLLLSIPERVEIDPRNRLQVVFRHPALRPLRVARPRYFAPRRGMEPPPAISVGEDGDDPP